MRFKELSSSTKDENMNLGLSVSLRKLLFLTEISIPQSDCEHDHFLN